MEISLTEPVTPVRPAAPYLGGKRMLATRICKVIAAIEHDGYAEPFVGMGGIFLRRAIRPRVEIINDISGDVVTFFRVLQEHYPYFIDMLRFRLASRNEFNRLTGQDPERLTDLQRAARFLYLQKLAFGGKPSGQNYGVDSRQGARFNVTKLEPVLADLHDRLAGVTIEQLPFAEFIRRYDRKGMLFYCDPPYFGCEDDYGKRVFEREDFDRMATLARQSQGRFLISLNDLPEVRKIFNDLHFLPLDTVYTIKKTGPAKKVGEVLICNRPFPEGLHESLTA